MRNKEKQGTNFDLQLFPPYLLLSPDDTGK